MVYRIIVNQGGKVDQLNHGAEGRCSGVGAAGGLFRQEQECGAEHLPLHLKQMRIDPGDQPEVRLDDAPKLLLHPLQTGAKGLLQLGERNRGGLMTHERRPAVSR